MKHLVFFCFFWLTGLTAFSQISSPVPDTVHKPGYVFHTDTVRTSGDSVFVIINAFMHDSIAYRSEVIFLPNSCILHGAYVSWYANGRKRSEGTYRYGFKINDWEYWDEAGNEIAGEAQKPY